MPCLGGQPARYGRCRDMRGRPRLEPKTMCKGIPMKMKLLFAVTAMSLTGCAASPMPPERNPSTEASIRGAEEAGANGVPAARLHLQMAKDEEDEAQRLLAHGDERARLVVLRSQADAELALGLAREASVHNEAMRA